MQMPEDRSEQDTFEEGTSFLFGPGAPREESSEGMTIAPPPTADIAEESAPGASPAPVSTRCNPLDPSTDNSTI
jgi:hypothetical protein